MDILISWAFFFALGYACRWVLDWLNPVEPEPDLGTDERWELKAKVAAQMREIAALRRRHTFDAETICDLQEQVAELRQFQTLIPCDQGAPTHMHHAGESPASAKGAPRA